MATLYHEHFKVRYATRGFGSWVLYFLSLAALVTLPFVIALPMGGLWTTSQKLSQRPDLKFTGRCLLRYTTLHGEEKLWSCTETINRQVLHGYEELAVVPVFSVHEDRHSADGGVDVVTVTLGLPVSGAGSSTGSTAPPPDTVDRVEFVPEFLYEIENPSVRVKMTGAPLIVFQRPERPRKLTTFARRRASAKALDGGRSCALTAGVLAFRAVAPIRSVPHVYNSEAYTKSLFDGVRNVDDIINVPHFAAKYALRNQSLVFERYAESSGGCSLLTEGTYGPVLDNSTGASPNFTWKIVLRVREAEVTYTPSILERIKWGWVQYFAIAYVVQWVLWRLRGMLVKYGLVGSIAVFDRLNVRH
uniref:Transmembrane protein 231 n=1 Tax=Trypanosoma congolense (strain IL3000) TaxID=1068625 RepID=G0UIV2_TRYCI|nr:conserved hypothetical protein [Trypanosoma congolense IL3000]